MLKKIGDKTVFFTFLTNLAINGCLVVTGILTARILQPVGRGELATIVLWSPILATLGLLGCNWALAREVAANNDREAILARTAMVLGLPLAAIFMVLGYFLIPHVLPSDKQHLVSLTRLYLWFIPIFILNQNFIALDHGLLRWTRFNLIRVSWYIPYLILIVGIWMFHSIQVEFFVLANLVSALFVTLLQIYLHRHEVMRGNTSLRECHQILRQGFPFFLGTVAGVLALRIDMILAVSLLPMAGVGFYAVAFTFASAHGSLGSALGVTSFAALANESDPKRQGEYLTGMFRQAALLYLGASCGIAFLAPLVIVPLFGLGFEPAIKPAVILVMATSLTALGNILYEGFRGIGNIYPGIGAQILASGVLALSAWLLVPSFGLMGMAGAAILGSLVFLIVMVVAVARAFGLQAIHFWAFRRGEMKILYQRFANLLQPLYRNILRK